MTSLSLSALNFLFAEITSYLCLFKIATSGPVVIDKEALYTASEISKLISDFVSLRNFEISHLFIRRIKRLGQTTRTYYWRLLTASEVKKEKKNKTRARHTSSGEIQTSKTVTIRQQSETHRAALYAPRKSVQRGKNITCKSIPRRIIDYKREVLKGKVYRRKKKKGGGEGLLS